MPYWPRHQEIQAGKMEHPKVNTVKNPAFSGIAALSTLANHHGLQGEVREFAKIVGMRTAPQELGDMIQVAAKIGLEAVPLEGPFEELAGCPFPMIVPLKQEAAGWRFTVVFEMKEDHLLIGDPEAGLKEMSHEDFRETWEQENGQGDVLAIRPGLRMETIREQLRINRSWRLRIQHALGLQPPWGRKLLFLAALMILVAVPWPQGGSDLALHICLATAVASSLWSVMFATRCSSCQGAGKLVGHLPLAQLGLIGYVCLFVLHFGGVSWLTELGLEFAAGIHLALVWLLWRGKQRCIACFITAGAAIAGAVTVVSIQPTPALEILKLAPSIVAMFLVANFGRYHYGLASEHQARKLARELATEARPQRGAHVVVFKKHDCKFCTQFSATVEPALKESFGDDLCFEERFVDDLKLDVPVMVIRGKRLVLVTNLRHEDAYEDALLGVQQALGEMDGAGLITYFPD